MSGLSEERLAEIEAFARDWVDEEVEYIPRLKGDIAILCAELRSLGEEREAVAREVELHQAGDFRGLMLKLNGSLVAKDAKIRWHEEHNGDG